MRRLFVVLVLMLLLTACAQEAPPASTPTPPAQGTTADPDSTSPGAQLVQLQEGDLREIIGQKTLTMVNLWGTFCNPCLVEMPHLSELAEEYADVGFQIVGLVIDVMDAAGNVDPAMQQLAQEIMADTGADNFTHLIPRDELSLALISTSGGAVPTTFFFDQEGAQVGDLVLGARSKADWTQIVEERLDMLEGAFPPDEEGAPGGPIT